MAQFWASAPTLSEREHPDLYATEPYHSSHISLVMFYIQWVLRTLIVCVTQPTQLPGLVGMFCNDCVKLLWPFKYCKYVLLISSSLVFIRERVSLQISLVLKCESHHFPHAYQHNADACDEKRVWSLHHWICLSENRFIMFSGVTNLNENWIAFQNKQSSWNIDTILPKTGVDWCSLLLHCKYSP